LDVFDQAPLKKSLRAYEGCKTQERQADPNVETFAIDLVVTKATLKCNAMENMHPLKISSKDASANTKSTSSSSNI
jgi:hypothetical protein